VTLTAFADAASKFAGWSGACSGAGPCTVTMDAATTVSASFAVVPAATAPKKNVCVVPNVTGKTLVVAKRKLVAAHCAAGSIRRAVSRVLPAGKVISQKPKAGARRKLGARVALVVSLGRL
jgi:beta-lactam-binding protein with PASTA domain